MDKKVLSIFIILVILISLAAAYIILNPVDIVEEQDDNFSDGDISDDDLNSEIDNVFLEENDEIEIGEMI